MSRPTDERGAELRQMFFESAQEMLQTLNDEALKLEQAPGNAENVRSIRRAVHTLKGDAAACGFRELSQLAHVLEDALALESSAAHASLAEIAFKAADTFTAQLNALRSGARMPSTVALRRMIADLGSASETKTKRRSKKSTSPETAPAVQWTEYESLAIQRAFEQGRKLYLAVIHIDRACAMPIAARQLIRNDAAALGEVLAMHPEATSPDATRIVRMVLATDKTAEQVTAKCRIPTIVSKIRVEAIETPARAAATAGSRDVPEPEPAHQEDSNTTAESGGPQFAAENVLRVDAERIDSVLNLVGELIMGKSMLQQALAELSRIHPKDPVRNRLADAMAFQSRVLNDLQRSVMKIRMVPVEQLFRRFPRMVRDVARQSGRNVTLTVSGEQTDLDKGILDTIAEPLTHLVRNAISHGIESPGERRALEKPEQGTIRLEAHHLANQVVIEVSDDGHGINVAKVRSKAVLQGLVSAEEAARMSEEEILDFIFRPGFSTAEQVTEIAGRGVGLDVVLAVLQRLKGTIEIENRPGRGTTFRLKLPLTLAIIKALLFRVEDRLYAIPLNAVAEIARARESDLHSVDHHPIVQLRNQVLSLIRLGRAPEETASSNSRIFILVISAGDRKLGLIVDALEGEEELVIKALDDQTVSTDLVSGASILGDGRVVLILHLGAVIERFNKSRLAGPRPSGLLMSSEQGKQAAGGTR